MVFQPSHTKVCQIAILAKHLEKTRIAPLNHSPFTQLIIQYGRRTQGEMDTFLNLNNIDLSFLPVILSQNVEMYRSFLLEINVGFQ